MDSRKLRWVTVGMAAALSCLRCGVPVCAFGAGDCAQMYANAPGSTTGTNTQNLLLFNTTPQGGTIKVSTPSQPSGLQITPTNGTPCAGGKYTYSVNPSQNTNGVDSNTGIFTASAPGNYSITVTDCGQPRKSGTVTATVTP